MTPETFCEQFATFAEAPNGVAKLRELILQLAVQGKLGTQDVNDEPASVVLAKVRTERERHNGEIPKQRPVSPITPDEQLFELPSGWTWARFGDLCLYIEAGSSPKCEERPRVGDEWGVIKISAVTWGRFNPDENKTLPPNLEPRIECEIRSGDFLMTRANTAELVAKSVVVDVTPPRLLLNDKTLRVVFPDSVSPQYVNLFNNGAIARRHYIRVASGTSESMRNVSRENVLEMPIPVPPLAEQRRIVGKVDQLLGLCDELAARQAARREARSALVGATLDRLVSARSAAEFPAHAHRLRDHFDRLFDTPTTLPQLRQAILQLAVQGQLVPQDPNDEPIDELVARVNEARRKFELASSARQRSELTSIGDEVSSFDPPQNWRWIRFGELANIVGGVTLGRKLGGRKLATFPYLRVANVQQGRLDLDVIKDIEIPIDELPKYRLEPGDVLLTEGGDWDKLGRSAIWRGEIENCLHQNHIFRARPFNQDIQPEWLTLFTNSPVGRKFFQNAAKQTTNLASINMTQLRNCPTPVPPLSEQKRIVSKVTELLSLCDALEAKLTQAESASTQLLSAAVHHLLTNEASPTAHREGEAPAEPR